VNSLTLVIRYPYQLLNAMAKTVVQPATIESHLHASNTL